MMWLSIFCSSISYALEWQPITHNEQALTDPEEGYGAIDIIGSLEWAIEDTELYIRFSVAEAEYSTETQWRILMKTYMNYQMEKLELTLQKLKNYILLIPVM